jgi:hypothetical protein
VTADERCAGGMDTFLGNGKVMPSDGGVDPSATRYEPHHFESSDREGSRLTRWTGRNLPRLQPPRTRKMSVCDSVFLMRLLTSNRFGRLCWGWQNASSFESRPLLDSLDGPFSRSQGLNCGDGRQFFASARSKDELIDPECAAKQSCSKSIHLHLDGIHHQSRRGHANL